MYRKINFKSAKLSKKIFLITLLLLLGLMSITMIFQLIFFQVFYESKKLESLTRNVNRFKEVYAYKSNSTQDLYNVLVALQNFEINTSSKVALYSANGNLISPSSTYINGDNNNVNSYFYVITSKSRLIQSVLETGETKSITFEESNGKSFAVVAPMSINNKNDSVLIAIASIQPIKEAAAVIKEFYLYIFLGFILVSILLSSIYSDLIAKPLVALNNVAKKMAKMDFSQKCDINSKDEVGNLAQTLNFLSTNLDNALRDLKRKNKQLEKDIEKERNLEVMRRDFTANVSHELKTPIGIIEGYAEGLRDGIVRGEDARVYLDTIIDESKKMSILVSNMLELSRLESGVLKPKLEVFNVNRLIKNLIRKHSMDAEEKDLTLEFIENTEYSYIHADTFQMEQILTNLITNALKYTPKGEHIIIEISEEKSNYKLSVINTGAHIEENEINKLFDKFYRADKARQRTNNSTGLGLSIVKNILQLHNFEYSLKNIENGVEFVIYMPIVNL